ncbi:hypothetical protein M9H77_03696 [Catharanthus roseus]|uniref:Uncharacterized protein n=1 Tax=Catharanthus roseus TaxID=4058 RepID=A0ACC0CCI5_CATRO|nr:hypothetical protein M9H77_03696 [Catharanthus roseus]
MTPSLIPSTLNFPSHFCVLPMTKRHFFDWPTIGNPAAVNCNHKSQPSAAVWGSCTLRFLHELVNDSRRSDCRIEDIGTLAHKIGWIDEVDMVRGKKDVLDDSKRALASDERVLKMLSERSLLMLIRKIRFTKSFKHIVTTTRMLATKVHGPAEGGEYSQTGTPMPTDAELILEVKMVMKKGYAYRFGVENSASMKPEVRGEEAVVRERGFTYLERGICVWEEGFFS